MVLEFTSTGLVQWAHQHDVYIDDTQPGCPYQNAHTERFNRTYRQEVLDLSLFTSLKDVQHITEHWTTIYNTERPHNSLNDMTSIEYKLT